MVKVTLQIPEELLGDIYMAVGAVLRRGYEEEAETERRLARKRLRSGRKLAPGPEPVADADETEA